VSASRARSFFCVNIQAAAGEAVESARPLPPVLG
jgi:hypothetical protein